MVIYVLHLINYFASSHTVWLRYAQLNTTRHTATRFIKCTIFCFDVFLKLVSPR